MDKSPYHVPVLSSKPAPNPEGPLAPFEQDQLRRLLNQFDAASPRIKAAFGEAIAPMISSVSLADSRPKVVRFRA